MRVSTMSMKPVTTDKELLMEHITTNQLNDLQVKYLIINGYLEIVKEDLRGTELEGESLYYVALTHKGIKEAYGKIDDYQKGTGKLF